MGGETGKFPLRHPPVSDRAVPCGGGLRRGPLAFVKTPAVVDDECTEAEFRRLGGIALQIIHIERGVYCIPTAVDRIPGGGRKGGNFLIRGLKHPAGHIAPGKRFAVKDKCEWFGSLRNGHDRGELVTSGLLVHFGLHPAIVAEIGRIDRQSVDPGHIEENQQRIIAVGGAVQTDCPVKLHYRAVEVRFPVAVHVQDRNLQRKRQASFRSSQNFPVDFDSSVIWKRIAENFASAGGINGCRYHDFFSNILLAVH
ncbi:hypothetical protein SDC9_76843 [bioreactor metagenome]|uniref:Uncharacterized protein n=1 Tax=bioreactor metagenome TaxID=1076179 RepID=A0A644YNX1_9ZZZZ